MRFCLLDMAIGARKMSPRHEAVKLAAKDVEERSHG